MFTTTTGLSIGLLVVGARRQREFDTAQRAGLHSTLGFGTVAAFTIGGVVLAVTTVVLVVAQT